MLRGCGGVGGKGCVGLGVQRERADAARNLAREEEEARRTWAVEEECAEGCRLSGLEDAALWLVQAVQLMRRLAVAARTCDFR